MPADRRLRPWRLGLLAERYAMPVLDLARLRRAGQRLGLPSISATTLRDYAHLFSGSMGRLCLSLLYFLCLTHGLSIVDFGFFASAVAVGTVLARLAAFGYGSNLFQVGAIRPRLLGHYYANYLLWLSASILPCGILAWLSYRLFFDQPDRLLPYFLIVASEVLPWRMIDTASTVSSGLGRFDHASLAFNIGAVCKAAMAILFLFLPGSTLMEWAVLYLVSNTLALALILVFLLPRRRLRWRRSATLLRARNALALSGSGLAYTLQAEIDKVLVLTFGGGVAAGMYAICIRVIDLTAVPIRAFNVLMIQRVLVNRSSMAGRRAKVVVELMIAAVSTVAYGGIVVALWFAPNMLGHEVAKAVGLLGLLWLVPALRNLIEYQVELLYANGRMTTTFYVALAVTVVKSALMIAVFWHFAGDDEWITPVNGVFLASYLVSTVMTYRALREPSDPPAILREAP